MAGLYLNSEYIIKDDRLVQCIELSCRHLKDLHAT